MTNWHAPIRWYIEGGFITFVFVLATIGCTLRIENGKVLPGLMFQETTGKTQIAVVLTLLALGLYQLHPLKALFILFLFIFSLSPSLSSFQYVFTRFLLANLRDSMSLDVYSSNIHR